MARTVVIILICGLLYVLLRMFTSNISVDSDVYGYYKDGRLNERGIISLVQQIKRLIPIKTLDTTVVGVTYNYEDGKPPKGQINYYHRIDDDKVEFYLSHRQEVVNHMAQTQCDNQEVVDMLKQLEKITISFYRNDQFLFGMEVSESLCLDGTMSRSTNEPVEGNDPNLNTQNGEVENTSENPAQSQTQNKEKDQALDNANTSGTKKGEVSKDDESVNNGSTDEGKKQIEQKGNVPDSNDQKDKKKSSVLSSHLSIVGENLPLKTSFGSLVKVSALGDNAIEHVFEVNGNELVNFAQKKSLIFKSYCTNNHLLGVLKEADYILLNFLNSGNSFQKWKLTKTACEQYKQK